MSTAMSIPANVGEERQPCLPATNRSAVVMVNTPYPEPTELPSEPCTEPASTETDAAPLSTQQMLTIVAPVAVFAVLLCAVIVGIGLLCCYLIIAKKSQKMRYVPRAVFHSVITPANTHQSRSGHLSNSIITLTLISRYIYTIIQLQVPWRSAS